MLSPLSKQRESPSLSQQLRSPRGSPRNSGSSPRNRGRKPAFFVALCARHFRYFFLCIFPLLLVLQWSMSLTPSPAAIGRNDLSLMETLEGYNPAPPSQHGRLRKMRSPTNSALTNWTAKPQERSNSKIERPPLQLLESYNYANSPLVPSSVYTPRSDNPLPVLLVGSVKSKDPQEDLLLDGLERSRYIEVVQSAEDWLRVNDKAGQVVVHLVDFASLSRDCHHLEKLYRGRHLPPSHQLVYFDMSASVRVITCPKVNALFHGRYRCIKQSIVQGRHWEPRNDWVSPGHIADNSLSGTGPLLHAPHFIRESFVDMVLEVMKAASEDLAKIVVRPRSMHVVHIWRKGDSSHYSQLRRVASQVIQEMNQTRINGRSLKWLVRPRGEEDAIEKGLPQPEYVVSLLNSKIVVVAQHDEWEDHLRLMEALAGGALVLSDPMLAAPHGLKNGTNIVTYHDAESLRRMILHYADHDHEGERVAIAQRGWEPAMGKHRSWHRMEQLFFGAARSSVGKPLDPAPTRPSNLSDVKSTVR
jgi:hypothetical protein